MSRNFHKLVCAFQVAQRMTRLLCENSYFKVFLRIVKNSCAENDVNACEVCGLYFIKALFTLREKLPRVNPGSTWVESTHVDFCSVNAHLPGLSPGKLNLLMEVGSSYPGSTRVGMRLHCRNLRGLTLPRLNPGSPWVTFFEM